MICLSTAGVHCSDVMMVERHGVSWTLNRLFKAQIKKTSKLRVIGLCEGNSPVTGEFPAQRASNAEYVSIGWRNHELNPPPPTCVSGTKAGRYAHEKVIILFQLLYLELITLSETFSMFVSIYSQRLFRKRFLLGCIWHKSSTVIRILDNKLNLNLKYDLRYDIYIYSYSILYKMFARIILKVIKIPSSDLRG